MFLFAAASLALALAPSPAVADETDGRKVESTAAGVTAAASGNVEDGQTYVCPQCGNRITLGRHGEAGLVMKCPACGAEICPEEEMDICFGVDVAFFDKYVSRGVTLSEDPVLQPNLWVSYKDITFSVWGSMDLTDVNGNEGDVNELDFTLDYSGSIDRFGYSVGAIYYTFPHTGDDDTAEVYAAISYDTLLSPTLVVYYDFLEADGFYGNVSIGHGFELPQIVKGYKSSLELSAQVGWGTKGFNEFNAGTYHTAFTDLVLTASLPVALSDNFSFMPVVSYSTVLDRTIRTKNANNDNVILGAVVSASF